MSNDITGTYSHSVDDKGRFVMPLDFRNALGGQCKMTKGMDPGTIYIYTMDEFEKLKARLLEESSSKLKVRNLVRIFLGQSVTIDLDRQGRCLIPQAFRNYAKIGSTVIISGLGNKIELWSAEMFDTFNLDGFNIAEATEDLELNI